jgi:carboxyl-terminal processing protease
MNSRVSSRFRAVVCGAAFCLAAAWQAFAAEAPAAEPVTAAAGDEEQLARDLQELRGQPLEGIWEPLGRLVRLGARKPALVTPKLETLVKDSDEKVRLGAAHALCQLTDPERGLKVLRDLLGHSKQVELRRAAAAAIAASPILDEDLSTPEGLKKVLKKETDPWVRLSCARALARWTYRSDAERVLAELMRAGGDPAVREEAALALGEQGGLRSPKEWTNGADPALLQEVHERLAALRTQPTARGERAARLFRDLEEEAAKPGDPKVVRGERLIREVLQRILEAYPDVKKCELNKLFEDAAKGMVGGLDPFSQYLDHAEVEATQEMLRQDYGGIGAYVGLREGVFTVLQPIYGAPAYRAGLRTLDTILEVEGEKTTEVIEKGGLSKVIAKLKGKPGTTVRVKFMRRGFVKPVEAEITRAQVRIESVHAALLPGGLGYLRLTRFGERSNAEVEKALAGLNKENARGLLLDLRDNPGGLLRSAVEVADHFLASPKLIVYSEGREEFAPRKSFCATGDAKGEALPMVVLVNAGSASASEIVAGALQDHKRATLVGDKTFGKGSVQQIIPMRATRGQTQLRLTIAKYYLPSGRCIHELGVEPDLKASAGPADDCVLRQIYDLRRKHVFEDYVRERWPAHKDLLLKLAQDDEGLTAGYPDFEAFLKSLGAARLSAHDVRLELRQALRRFAQDELKTEFPCDLETDDVLQRGILELLGKLNVEPASIAQYKGYPEKFKKESSGENGLSALPVPALRPIQAAPEGAARREE